MTKSARITIPADEMEGLQEISRIWRMTPEETALRIIRLRLARNKWEAMKPVGRKIAKRLGIKTDADVERLFGDPE